MLTEDTYQLVLTVGAVNRNEMRRKFAQDAHYGVSYTETKAFVNSEFVIIGPRWYINTLENQVYQQQTVSDYLSVDKKEARRLIKAAKEQGIETRKKRDGKCRKVTFTAKRHVLNDFLGGTGYFKR